MMFVAPIKDIIPICPSREILHLLISLPHHRYRCSIFPSPSPLCFPLFLTMPVTCFNLPPHRQYHPSIFSRVSLCRSVGPSVRRKSLCFFRCLELKGDQIWVTAPGQLLYCPCPPARDWCYTALFLVQCIAFFTFSLTRACDLWQWPCFCFCLKQCRLQSYQARILSFIHSFL